MLRSRVAHSVVSVSRHSRGTNAQWKRTHNNAAEEREGVAEDRVLGRVAFASDESAIIRAPSFPGSMRDVLAIVRAVERNYGVIREFKCYRVSLIPIILIRVLTDSSRIAKFRLSIRQLLESHSAIHNR